MITLLIIIGVFLLILIMTSKEQEDICPDCGYYCNCNSAFCLPPNKEKEEMFYHSVTGYKGTKSEMDTYIQNREKELKKNNKN